MKILYLGPGRPDLIEYLVSFGDQVYTTENPITSKNEVLGFDFLISYRYRHIIKPEILECFPKRAINLHISLLPWNRGADPNLWSFLENTPKGVTIHFLDVGVDTGAILVQEEVDFSASETLKSSYDRLGEKIEALLKKTWPDIRSGKLLGKKQKDGGSAHRLKDKEAFLHLLHKGWDTPVEDLVGKVNREK